MQHEPDPFQEIRDAVRALCAQYPDEYFRRIDEQRGYPEAFVDALTQADEATCQAAQGVDGIALSVSEQYAASAEISKSVEQMAQLADQNMNAVTRTSDAAVHLQHLAGDLATSMARFKVS